MELSFGKVLPLWVLEAVPVDAEPLSVLSTGLAGVRTPGEKLISVFQG